MFRKAFFAFSFILVTSPAVAQNTTCSDRPPSDSSNACANTRFVHNATSGASTPVLPVTTITSSGSISTSGTYLCDATSGNVTITLPLPTVKNGAIFVITRKDATTNLCLVQSAGGAAIDTIVSLGVEPQNTSFTLVSDGSVQWWIQ